MNEREILPSTGNATGFLHAFRKVPADTQQSLWLAASLEVAEMYKGIEPERIQFLLESGTGQALGHATQKALKTQERAVTPENLRHVLSQCAFDILNKDYGFPYRNPEIPLITKFDSLAAYNHKGKHHPLPDLTATDFNWEKSYTGFEPSTLLPVGLTERIAANYVSAAARFHDAINLPDLSWEEQRKAPFERFSSAYYKEKEKGTPDEVALAVFGMMQNKTAGNILVKPDYLTNYLALTAYHEGDFDYSVAKLKKLGIKTRPFKNEHTGLPEFYSHEPRDGTTASQLLDAFASISGASALGFLMATFDHIKPQYTQPNMFYVGDAMERAARLMPGLAPAITPLQEAYEKTGFARAVEKMRALATQDRAKHPAI